MARGTITNTQITAELVDEPQEPPCSVDEVVCSVGSTGSGAAVTSSLMMSSGTVVCGVSEISPDGGDIVPSEELVV